MIWFYLKEKEETQAPAVGAKATYGGIAAPPGAILITRKYGPESGHNNGQHCPALLLLLFYGWEIDLISIIIQINIYLIIM